MGLHFEKCNKIKDKTDVFRSRRRLFSCRPSHRDCQWLCPLHFYHARAAFGRLCCSSSYLVSWHSLGTKSQDTKSNTKEFFYLTVLCSFLQICWYVKLILLKWISNNVLLHWQKRLRAWMGREGEFVCDASRETREDLS